MSSIRKHKLQNKVALLGDADDISIFGASAEDATTWSSLISELAKTGGGIAASELKKKEDAKKAEEEKAKNKEANDARAAAAAARKKASLAAADALAETSPTGPLHQAAAKAESDARVAEARAAYYGAPSGSMGPIQPLPPAKAGVPWWGWLLGAGFVTIGGALTYRLVRKK